MIHDANLEAAILDRWFVVGKTSPDRRPPLEHHKKLALVHRASSLARSAWQRQDWRCHWRSTCTHRPDALPVGDLVQQGGFPGDRACLRALCHSQLEDQASSVPYIRMDGRCACTSHKRAECDLGAISIIHLVAVCQKATYHIWPFFACRLHSYQAQALAIRHIVDWEVAKRDNMEQMTEIRMEPCTYVTFIGRFLFLETSRSFSSSESVSEAVTELARRKDGMRSARPLLPLLPWLS